MKISFRFRIALLSLLLTGVALITLSGFSWWQIRESKMQRLDTQINNFLILLSRGQKLDRLSEHEERLAHLLGDDDEKRVFLIAFNNHELFYDSSNLNKEMVNTLPWPIVTQQPLRHEWIDSRFKNRPPPPPMVNFTDVRINRKNWHIGLIATPELKIAIGIDNAFLREEMRPITGAFVISIPMVLILVAAAAWWLAGRALKPIETLTNTIKSISTKELNERVAITSSDKEFSQLITVFNELLGRLERSFQQATRFSGDAAHELKTPLAIIQGQLESSIQAADAGSVIQEKLSHTLDEVRRLSSISQKLLLLSQADAGKLRLHREPFALSQTLTDITEDAQMLAPSINITCDITSNITINADAVLLRQALQNIITNAIKYNIENGWITITAQKTVGDIIIEIKNSSTRLSQEVSKNLFERFYRGDASHNRQVEGFGLGLSLAQEIIKAHDGSLTLNKNTEHETGFLIMLSDRSK